MSPEAVMPFPPASDTDTRSSAADEARTSFAQGVVALFWIGLIVLLIPILILLVGLPVAAILRLLVDGTAWVAGLVG
jgi:hypothetical protein